LNAAGVNNVMLTLSRTPWWAVTTAQWGDTNCNYYDQNLPLQHYYGGACYAPNGPTGENHLNPDGTGDDLIWRNWVTAIATEVNSLGTGYAQVKYWEIWNEFDRNNPNAAAVSWYARTGLSGACTLAPCPTPTN
jgi:hypothetical protein